jgi:hypothetical protein
MPVNRSNIVMNCVQMARAGWLGIWLGYSLSAAGLVAQQDVFVPLPQAPVQAPQPFGVQMVPDPSLLFAPSPESPFEWGSFILKPHFLYRFLYGDGVQSRPGHQLTTAINSFSPGVLMNLGNWTLDYTPTWNLYSNSAFRDTLGEDERLAGILVFSEETTLKLSQSYLSSSQPLIETGRQTSEQDLSEAVDISHRFSQEIFSETIFEEASRFAVGFPDSDQWSVTNWLHYQFSPQLDTALGANLGLITFSEGPEIEFVSPEAQATWAPSSKVSVTVSGGVDHREFLTTPRNILTTPIYSATLQYNPFEWTGISITAAQQVNVSYFLNQSTKNTMWRAGLTQRLLEQFLLIASVGQQDTDYISDSTAKNAGREDDTLRCNLRLSWPFLQRGTLTLLYQWSRNNSNVPGFAFSSHQVGIEVGYKF